MGQADVFCLKNDGLGASFLEDHFFKVGVRNLGAHG